MGRAIDVIVLDLDGTLLCRNGCISPRNCEAVVRAARSGVTIVVATGRALAECRHYLQEIGHDGPVITAGGSMLSDASTGETLHRKPVNTDVVESVTQALVDHGYPVLNLKDSHAAGYDYFIVGSGELDAASQWWFDHLPVQLRYGLTHAEDEHPEHTVRVGIVAEGTDLPAIAESLRGTVGNRAFLHHWPAVTATHAIGSTTHLLEIFSPGVDKWTMVELFCEQQGLSTGRVAAIGDERNDIQMIHQAAIGIAMGNGSAEVIEVADHVTSDHNEDGVAEAIELLLSGQLSPV